MRWDWARSPHFTLRPRPRPEPPRDDAERLDRDVEAQVHVMGSLQPALAVTAAGVDDAWQSIQRAALSLEVDDTLAMQAGVTDQNAAVLLEATQKLRELRERERSSLAPVHNFDPDAFSSRGGDW